MSATKAGCLIQEVLTDSSQIATMMWKVTLPQNLTANVMAGLDAIGIYDAADATLQQAVKVSSPPDRKSVV